MAEITFQANRLTETDVDRVSLVKRASNRLPFRILKSEGEPMLDLAKIGRSLFRKGEAGPTLVAVVLSKSADPAIAAVLMKAAGHTDETRLTKSENAEAHTVTVTDAELDGAGVVRLNDDVAIVVSGLQKAFSTYDFTSQSFKDVAAAGGFFPGVGTALEMLRTTTFNIMDQAESPADAATALQKACGEFADYLGALAKNLPVHAFKAEVELQKAMPAFIQAAIDKKKGKGKDGAKDADADDTEAGKKDPTKKGEEISANPVHGNDTQKPQLGTVSNDIEGAPVAGSTTSEDPTIAKAKGNIEGNPVAGNDTQTPLPVKKDEEPDLGALLSGFAEQLTKGIGDRLGAIEALVKSQGDTLTSVVTQVQKTENVISQTVFGSAPEDRTGDRVTKSETKEIPLIDTAFDRSHLRG